MPRYLLQQRNQAQVVLAGSEEEAIQIAGCDKYAQVHVSNLDNCDPGMYSQVKLGMTSKGEEDLDNLLLSCLYKISVEGLEARKKKIKESNAQAIRKTYHQTSDGTVYSDDSSIP